MAEKVLSQTSRLSQDGDNASLFSAPFDDGGNAFEERNPFQGGNSFEGENSFQEGKSFQAHGAESYCDNSQPQQENELLSKHSSEKYAETSAKNYSNSFQGLQISNINPASANTDLMGNISKGATIRNVDGGDGLGMKNVECRVKGISKDLSGQKPEEEVAQVLSELIHTAEQSDEMEVLSSTSADDSSDYEDDYVTEHFRPMVQLEACNVVSSSGKGGSGDSVGEATGLGFNNGGKSVSFKQGKFYHDDDLEQSSSL